MKYTVELTDEQVAKIKEVLPDVVFAVVEEVKPEESSG
jgi:hypothetical protein